MSSGTGPKFVHASSSSVRRGPSSTSRGLKPIRPPGSQHEHPLLSVALTNTTTNTTNATASVAPTPVPPPTPPPTPVPTKHYESPEDEEKDKEEEETKEKEHSVGMIFLWIVVAFAGIWLFCYFRDAISFFFANAWNNTRRYGCRGCLQSFFPCIAGSRAGGGNEPLDQIIFESEDANAPLMVT